LPNSYIKRPRAERRQCLNLPASHRYHGAVQTGKCSPRGRINPSADDPAPYPRAAAQAAAPAYCPAVARAVCRGAVADAHRRLAYQVCPVQVEPPAVADAAADWAGVVEAVLRAGEAAWVAAAAAVVAVAAVDASNNFRGDTTAAPNSSGPNNRRC
jgi:hypothetical protein